MASKNPPSKIPIALPRGESNTTIAVSQEISLQMSIGARVRVTTGATSVEGIIYTADPLTNLLVLNTSPSTTNTSTMISPASFTAPPGAYRILSISQISSFQLLNLPSPQSLSNVTTPTNTLDTAALQHRLTRALHTAHQALSRQGPKGTTPTDQALFDALSRTHPAHWEGSTMVISDTFAIDKPYSSATVRFADGGSGVGDLERMKKVVDMEKNKVVLRMGKGEIDGRMASGPIEGIVVGKKGG